MKSYKILISNDDGYEAKGIAELVSMIHDMGEIIVCAPETTQSGKSRAFTMTPITLREVEGPVRYSNVKWFACSGTPIDCVKIAFDRLCHGEVDLILGGINHGDNASTNTHYSGTTAIAYEGTLKGVPSIAFSLCDYSADANFSPMTDHVRMICRKVLSEGLPPLTFLNVNVPKVSDASELCGIKVCRMAKGEWKKEVVDPKECPEAFQDITEGEYFSDGHNTSGTSKETYCLRGYYLCHEPEASDTDAWALRHGYIAITPSTIDITSYAALDMSFE